MSVNKHHECIRGVVETLASLNCKKIKKTSREEEEVKTLFLSFQPGALQWIECLRLVAKIHSGYIVVYIVEHGVGLKVRTNL